MRRFEFRLEKALEVRELRRLLAEERLGEARRAEDRSRAKLGLALDMRDDCFTEMRLAMGGRVNPEGMRHLIRYESSLEDEIVRQRDDLVKKEAITRAATEEVVSRTQDERTLERHRENRFREYRASYWWEQGKALDEVGRESFIRNRGR